VPNVVFQTKKMKRKKRSSLPITKGKREKRVSSPFTTDEENPGWGKKNTGHVVTRREGRKGKKKGRYLYLTC